MTKAIRVLHVSTHNEDCGIGKYQEMFLEAMGSSEFIDNKFFDVSPNTMKHMNREDLLLTIKNLEVELSDYDILHVQHEFSFYFRDEFKLICETGIRAGKKVIATLHTSPFVAYNPPHLGGLGPRSFAHYLRAVRRKQKIFNNFITPLTKIDMIIVHNRVTRDGLAQLGVDRSKIRDLIIPVPQINHILKTTDIKGALNLKTENIVYCVVGFLHQFKGVKDAVKALSFLPDKYKLAIIGGVHPQADNEKIYNEITDLIRDLNLMDRVYITGFVKDYEKMNALIRECDICIFPYDRVYYSQVSSAALNNSFANYMPTVAYPTESFKELDEIMPVITLTQSCSYYELAKEISALDLEAACKISRKFAEEFSYPKVSSTLEAYYRELCPQ